MIDKWKNCPYVSAHVSTCVNVRMCTYTWHGCMLPCSIIVSMESRAKNHSARSSKRTYSDDFAHARCTGTYHSLPGPTFDND